MEQIEQPGGSGQPAAPQTSLGARLMNVFVAPGEVFAEIKDTPVVPANWVVPTVIAMIAGIVYVMVVFSQPAVLQGMKEAREKQMQEQVTAGKMTQRQADTASEMADKFSTPTIMKSFGIIGVLFATAGWLFLSALVCWLIGRFGMHGQIGYMKSVEVVGLSFMISALSSIVAMLIAVIYGNMAMTPSAILAVGHFDNHNRVHSLLAQLNVMTIWWLAVAAVGVAQVTGRGFLRAATWMFGLWAVLTVGLIFLFVR